MEMFHINEEGKVMPCKAQSPETCPVKNILNVKTDHYTSQEIAQKESEKQLELKYRKINSFKKKAQKPKTNFTNINDISTINNYYESVETSLNIISQMIQKQEFTYSENDYIGRDGSSRFEDFVKTAINKDKENIISECNKNLKDVKVISIDSYISDNESDNRRMEDMSFILEDSYGNQSEIMINIKATSGNTADNVGGWASFGRALYGDEAAKLSAKQILEKTKTEPLENTLNDYFLWVFNKKSDKDNIFSSSKIFSYFATDLDHFKINMHQPFPLQFKSTGATNKPFTSTDSLIERKKALVSKIKTEGKKFYLAKLKQFE